MRFFLLITCAFAFSACATGPTVEEQRAAYAKKTAAEMEEYKLRSDRASAAREKEDEKHAAEADARRRAFITAHPQLSPTLAASIRAGELAVGMQWNEIEASIGKISWNDSSDGVGGRWDSAGVNDGYYTMRVYLRDGRLVRWQRTSNY